MTAIALALGSSIAWGTADFIGGIATRRLPLTLVLTGTAVAGVLTAATLVALSGETTPNTTALAYGAAAGLAGLGALAAFYRALAIGKMSVVAPISASGTALPVAVGIARGEPLDGLTVAGFALTVGGIMLASREQQDPQTAPTVDAAHDSRSGHRRSIPLALVAAIGFGLAFVLVAESGESAALWPALMVKASGALTMAGLLGGLAATSRAPRIPTGAKWLLPLATVGTLDVVAIAAFAYASARGPLSVTAVLASLFPVVTVLLAHVFLGERLLATQRIGVAMALAGVVLLAAA